MRMTAFVAGIDHVLPLLREAGRLPRLPVLLPGYRCFVYRGPWMAGT
jgi:hypothetical protein